MASEELRLLGGGVEGDGLVGRGLPHEQRQVVQ